nr:retrovirus-related Pol polyprotein from transposon TNT 1-94 [Tanacetum cinerariifolium]
MGYQGISKVAVCGGGIVRPKGVGWWCRSGVSKVGKGLQVVGGRIVVCVVQSPDPSPSFFCLFLGSQSAPSNLFGRLLWPMTRDCQGDCWWGKDNKVKRDRHISVRFGNDHVAASLGFGDLKWGNILITRVYFIEGLGHNLFSVGQFCDSDLKVAFRRNACFVRNLEGVDFASSTMSWLWHQRLSHLNFDTINDLARNDLVAGLPKFKYHKEHLCPSCEQGKSKRASHPPNPVPNSRQTLHLLHMDLCGPMRIASINGKRYILVIVDDYSRYTWVHFLRSKDEAPAVIIMFLKRITVLLQSPVIIIRTDNGTEFKNQVLKEYFDSAGISHQMSS